MRLRTVAPNLRTNFCTVCTFRVHPLWYLLCTQFQEIVVFSWMMQKVHNQAAPYNSFVCLALRANPVLSRLLLWLGAGTDRLWLLPCCRTSGCRRRAVSSARRPCPRSSRASAGSGVGTRAGLQRASGQQGGCRPGTLFSVDARCTFWCAWRKQFSLILAHVEFLSDTVSALTIGS